MRLQKSLSLLPPAFQIGIDPGEKDQEDKVAYGIGLPHIGDSKCELNFTILVILDILKKSKCSEYILMNLWERKVGLVAEEVGILAREGIED
jgi:hypothetical protein